jgi:hypothetical protein
MNNIDNSVVNKESAMSIAFVIFAILAIITAVWKGSVMNKFVANKESVMLVVSKRSIGLAFSIVCTAALFIPYALVATFQDMVVCTLALAPLAFTAIDILIHVEYHDEVRSIALAYNALKGLPAYEAKVKAKYAAMFLALFCSACGTDTAEVPEYSAQVKLDINWAESNYQEVVAELEEYYYQLSNIHTGIGMVNTTEDKGPLEEMSNCTAFKWQSNVYTAQHCVREHDMETGDIAVNANKYQHDIEADLYEVGTECSPDLRWWGKSNDGWGTIPMEQAFTHYKKVTPDMKLHNELLWAYMGTLHAQDDYMQSKTKKNMQKVEIEFKALVEAYRLYIADAADQRFICAAGVALELKPIGGDSGGPLMLGDEVIGFVSYGEEVSFKGEEHELFDNKYSDALQSSYTFCWGTFDRSQDRPYTEYTEKNTRRYNDLRNNFVAIFGQKTINSWEK